jgi:hypothetical protein
MKFKLLSYWKSNDDREEHVPSIYEALSSILNNTGKKKKKKMSRLTF